MAERCSKGEIQTSELPGKKNRGREGRAGVVAESYSKEKIQSFQVEKGWERGEEHGYRSRWQKYIL